MEIIWTGVISGFKGERTLKGTTSLWMFPVYGMVILLEPVFILFAEWPVFIRGVIYMLLIFSAEFLWGTYLNKAGLCPWDYSKAEYNVAGIIRLDYAPLWFGAGLFYERIFNMLLVIM